MHAPYISLKIAWGYLLKLKNVYSTNFGLIYRWVDFIVQLFFLTWISQLKKKILAWQNHDNHIFKRGASTYQKKEKKKEKRSF